MIIKIDPKREARLRERAEAEGLTVSAFIERLISAEQSAEEEIESLALAGLNSGAPISPQPRYWEEKHIRLEACLKEKRDVRTD